jgi:hypothetical protein
MGTYYFLLNDTKKEYIHLDSHIKMGPIMLNNAVHRGLVNYIFEHQFDVFRMIPDSHDYEYESYQKIDLLHYKFKNSDIMKIIIAELNLIYATRKDTSFCLYGIRDGIGFDVTMRTPDRLWARTIFSLAKWLIGLGYRLAYYGGMIARKEIA